METKTGQTEERQGLKEEKQLVSFMLGEEEFGFDIMAVQEIIRTPKIARVPLTPHYVDGVANLRGMVLPIVDMRTRFGMERIEDTDRTRVLVIDLNGHRTGLRVDRVRQVDRISTLNIEPPPNVIGEASSKYVDGVVKLEDGKRIIITLKAEEICRACDTSAAEDAAMNQTTVPGQELSSASEDAKTSQEVMTQMVTFRVGREEYGFQIEKVREILRVETARRIPESPPYLEGVLTVRGRLLPIIDLRMLLGQPTMADELRVQCEELRCAYEAWAIELEAFCSGTTGTRPGDFASIQLREWLKLRTSTSEALAEVVTVLRADNEQALRTLSALWNAAQNATNLSDQFSASIKPLLEKVVADLKRYEGLVATNIKEDQRIVVVDAGGVLLGLVVDHVKEVMNAPNNCIEAAPQLSESRNAELAGIAKLDDGKRLILILNSNRLLGESETKQLLESTGVQKGSASTNEHSEMLSKEDAGQADERQVASFRLGKEEFGIPIAQIREIDRYSQITHIPRVPDYVEGVTNLRGEVIPVINLRNRFKMSPQRSR